MFNFGQIPFELGHESNQLVIVTFHKVITFLSQAKLMVLSGIK